MQSLVQPLEAQMQSRQPIIAEINNGLQKLDEQLKSSAHSRDAHDSHAIQQAVHNQRHDVTFYYTILQDCEREKSIRDNMAKAPNVVPKSKAKAEILAVFELVRATLRHRAE